MANHHSIGSLRIYQSARQLEDAVYQLAADLPPEEHYELGDRLRRSSAAIAHYIHEYHRRYGYNIKLEALHLARAEAQNLKVLLADYQGRGFGPTKPLQHQCVGVAKQAWGLVRYVKQRQNERQTQLRIEASDHLVAARA